MATRARRKDAGQAQAEGPKHNHVFRNFGGINTQAARQALAANEFSWIENVQPIGHGNCRVVPARSASLATVASGACYYMEDYNIAGLNYMFMATDNGHAYQVGLASPYTRTLIGAAFSNSGLQIAQWKNERILIVDPANGYFTWDGTTLTGNGSLLLATVTNGGAYTVLPTWTVTGGGGAGGAVASVLGLAGAQTITNAGTGYVAGDIITLNGGTFSSPGKLRVVTVGGGGTVTAVSIFQAGSYTVLGVAPLATSGAGNNDCTITPAYEVISLIVTNGGTVPYVSPPTLTPSAGAAAATAVLLDGPTGGEHIATFSGRVWISVNRTLNYSVPDSYYDFSGAGSGSTIITDSTLHSGITQLISANSFLYFTGVDSINVIGDVQLNDTGDTVFSNTNLSASIGTDEGASLLSYYRAVWLANRSGMYTVYGSTPAKVSDPLDGIVEKIDFTQPISSGTFFLNNILCSAFLCLYMDPIQGVTRPILTIFFNKKWFIGGQGDLVFIASGQQGGLAGLYGTDGTNLFKLFDDEDASIDWTLSSAYWDMDDLIRDKQITKFGFEFNVPDSAGTVTVTLQALASTPPYASNETYDVAVTSDVTWINNAGNTVQWMNNALDIVEWLGESYFMDMQDGTQFGKYIGITMASDDVRGDLNSMLLEYTYRVRW